MRKKIYLAIVEALKRAELAKYISLWNEDLDSLEKVAATDFPAIYVEFTPVHWIQKATRVKSGRWQVNLHIITSTLASPEDGSPSMEEALETYDTIDQIVAVMQGVNGEGFNQFQHIDTIPDHAHGDVQHDIEYFVSEVTDTSAMRVRTTIGPLTPKIKATPAGK